MDVFSLKRFTDEGIIDEELRAERLFPPLAVDNASKLFVCDDKTIGWCYECTPLPGGDERERDKLQQLLSQNFPSDMTMQFFLFRSPDIEQELRYAERMRIGHDHPLLTPVFKGRMAFLREKTQKDIIAKTGSSVFDIGRVIDLKLIISVKVPFSGEKPDEADIVQATQWKTKISSSLKSIGLGPHEMDADDYIRTMNSIFNWSPDATWRKATGGLWENDKPISAQILDPNTSIFLAKDDCIQLGDDNYMKVLSAKKLPSRVYFGEAMQVVGDLYGQNQGVRQNYAIVVNVYFPNVDKAKDNLTKRRQWATQQAFGPLVKFEPVIGEVKESFDIIYDATNKGGKPVRMSYSMLIFGKSEKEVTSASTQAQNIWATMRFVMMEDKYVMLPMLRNTIPLGTDRFAIRELWRYKTMTTNEIPTLLPIFGEWKGTGTPHVSLISRNGQLMSLSMHDTSTNKNCVIAAESGSGKSFLLNEIILSYMSEGARVWVIDAGKSYQKLCDSLKGDFVMFGDESNICLNPFELIDSWEEEEDGIVALVAAMASAQSNLNDLQIAELKRVMNELWVAKGKGMTIDDIRANCLESEDPRVKDIGKQLFAFSEGNYGRYFSGKNNASFTNDFTVLELDELQGRKHLRQVVLLQLVFQIQRDMYLGDRDRKKILIIDEAWDLLKEGQIATFMEHAYRKFRKYGGSAVIATQSINDLYENAVGRAIAENSATMLLLGQKKETIESVKEKKRLSLSEGGFNLLRTVHTEKGVYSEIYVYSEHGQGVGRLIVNDFQKLLYSTDAPDVQAITNYMNSGMSVDDAIHQVMRDRHIGEDEEELAKFLQV